MVALSHYQPRPVKTGSASFFGGLWFFLTIKLVI